MAPGELHRSCRARQSSETLPPAAGIAHPDGVQGAVVMDTPRVIPLTLKDYKNPHQSHKSLSTAQPPIKQSALLFS
ncbi:hypothetical protein MJO28_015615 [Puccinia striiformis f. sp. tritici]|uniref:Uncharacterized protein n=1 Tax=Puccinia striiformis f. sp. tritici TaxID=168172 RepID=A0ACC0DP68_9BASI|nr:hypothetical protein MJO28_015615 [Puccinia striiformis f. sp. tritici]